MRLKASDEFVAGRHGIARIGPGFQERFHPMSFVPAASAETVEIPLPRYMTDEEILNELNPNEGSLTDLFNHIHLPHRWPWGIWYVSDVAGTLRSVQCTLVDGEWHLESSDRLGPWTSTYRVYSPAWSSLLSRLLRKLKLT